MLFIIKSQQNYLTYLALKRSNMYLIIKSLHIISIISWMACLLYLVRLFVYHSQSKEETINCQLAIMEKRLLKGIGNPAMLASLVFGIWLVVLNPSLGAQPWFFVKVIVVIILLAYHMYCGALRKKLATNTSTKSSHFYRIFNELSTILMILIVFLVETQNITTSFIAALIWSMLIFVIFKLFFKKK